MNSFSVGTFISTPPHVRFSHQDMSSDFSISDSVTRRCATGRTRVHIRGRFAPGGAFEFEGAAASTTGVLVAR